LSDGPGRVLVLPAKPLLLAALLPLVLSALVAFLPWALLPVLGLDLLLAALALSDAVAGRRDLAVEALALPPGPLSLGRAARISYRVTNRSPRRLALSLLVDLPRDFLALGRASAGTAAAAASGMAAGTAAGMAAGRAGMAAGAAAAPLRVELEPGETALLSFPVLPGRRGPFEFGALHLRCKSPARLFTLSFRAGPPLGVTVYPDLVAVAEERARRRAGQSYRTGKRRARRRTEGTEPESLRDYLPGEDARRIDWKASLRLGKPIAREYREDSGSLVAFALDCGRLMATEAGGQTILDSCLSGLLVLASTVLSGGDGFRGLAFARDIEAELPELRGPDSLRRVAAFSAALAPVPVEADYRLAAARLLGCLTKRSLVVILTDAAESLRLEALEAAVTALSRRHAVVVALFRDEGAEALAGAPVHGADEVFRKAAAVELVLARERLAARLRRRASVVSVSPRELRASLLEVYAEAKKLRRF
jgi:uncharacterized protein (DUF58 family)